MKHRFLVIAGLLILIIITQAGCQGQTSTVTELPPTEQPTTPPATEIPLTEPPADGAPTEEPATLLVPEDKPSLIIPDEQGVLSGAGISPAHAIGFVFPDGLRAMKAAAINNPYIAEDNLTVVGVVEIGEGAEKITPGVYTVAIDLTNVDAEEVDARLVPQQDEGEEQNLTFGRTTLERNGARADSPSFPTVSPIISGDAVCFVIGLSEKPGEVSQSSPNVKSWSRYCSLASVDSSESILSVRDNFPSQFRELIGSWEQSIEHLTAQGFPQDVNIVTELTISEMEGHKNINACNGNQECSSDITGAPNALFWEQYGQAKAAAEGNNFVVTSGIVRIERLMEIPGQVDVQPGDYWVRLWFDPQETFLGATLLGVTVENDPIYGQSIPAIPSYFVDTGNPQNVVSWISGWRVCDWCKWQSNCP